MHTHYLALGLQESPVSRGPGDRDCPLTNLGAVLCTGDVTLTGPDEQGAVLIFDSPLTRAARVRGRKMQGNSEPGHKGDISRHSVVRGLPGHPHEGRLLHIAPPCAPLH